MIGHIWNRTRSEPSVVRRIPTVIWRPAVVLVAALAISACARTPPTPLGASPTSAPSPGPSRVASPQPTAENPGTTATPPSLANATETSQAEDTAVARAVEETVTVEIQALGTAVIVSAQETATAAAPNGGPGSAGYPAPPTAPPTAAPTLPPPSPTRLVAPGCPVQPVRGFGLLYATNAAVGSHLGCPVDAEVGTPTRVQPFEGGLMLSRGIATEVLVLRNTGGAWSAFPNTYQNGQPLPTRTVAAPAGRFAPTGAFGLVWERQADVRGQLGWATAPEQDSSSGASENFVHGRAIWTPSRTIYVLYSDNTWQSFPDAFQG